MQSAAWVMSAVRIGEATSSRSMPVPASKSASRCAIGKAHPSFCTPLHPKWAMSSSVSGIEQLDPSTSHVRCPRQANGLPPAVAVAASQTRDAYARTTSRGRRARAARYPSAVNPPPAIRATSAHETLPAITCRANSDSVTGGLSTVCRHSSPDSRQTHSTTAGSIATWGSSLIRASALEILTIRGLPCWWLPEQHHLRGRPLFAQVALTRAAARSYG